MIKAYCLLVLAFVKPLTCPAQITGSFVGIFFENKKNLLLLSEKDTLVSGALFSSTFERYAVAGTRNKSSLTIFFLAQGTTYVFSGSVTGDTIQFNEVADTLSIRKIRVFFRISNKPNYSAEKFYKNDKLERDERLIGRWGRIKKTGLSGSAQQNEYSIVTFAKNGDITEDGPTMDKIKAIMKENGTKMPTFTWQTKSGNLIMNAYVDIPNFPGPTERVHQYYFSGDTLVEVGPLAKMYYLRIKHEKKSRK